MPVGEKVKALKKQFGYTTADLAAKANLPADTINKIISGATRAPSVDTLMRIASAFDTTVDALLDDSLPSAANPEQTTQTGVNDALLKFYLAALDSQREAYDKALKHSNDDKRRWFLIALALIAFVVFVLIWDITHPTMGYVQY